MHHTLYLSKRFQRESVWRRRLTYRKYTCTSITVIFMTFLAYTAGIISSLLSVNLTDGRMASDVEYISQIWPKRLLKNKSRHDANFVVTGGSAGCHTTTCNAASNGKVGIMPTFVQRMPTNNRLEIRLVYLLNMNKLLHANKQGIELARRDDL